MELLLESIWKFKLFQMWQWETSLGSLEWPILSPARRSPSHLCQQTGPIVDPVGIEKKNLLCHCIPPPFGISFPPPRWDLPPFSYHSIRVWRLGPAAWPGAPMGERATRLIANLTSSLGPCFPTWPSFILTISSLFSFFSFCYCPITLLPFYPSFHFCF